jgi:hypothetical protein
VPAVSTDPFDTARGSVVTGFSPGTIDPTNTFHVPPDGCDVSETAMPDVNLGGVTFIEFRTLSSVTVRGVRVFAANDVPGLPHRKGRSNSSRRGMSQFRLLADRDGNGSFETVAADAAINPNYSEEPANQGTRMDLLDLTILNLGGAEVTARRWRLEVRQGSNLLPFEGVRILEVDGLPPLLPAPPVIVIQPVGTNVPPGGDVTLCVLATGHPPPVYQWRRNGVKIPGATNDCLVLTALQARDGGTFDVVASNPSGGVVSDPARVVVTVPVLPPGDNLADRVPLTGVGGTVRGSNLNATREPGEPRHVGKPGGASVWYSFTSGVEGVVSIDTAGSSIDTLLAVYTGATIPTLAEVASDEESGGALTSLTRFNVSPGVEYVIVVDGHGAAMGDFVFTWDFQPTTEMYPVILVQPESATVPPGVDHTLFVIATGTNLLYQWFFNGEPVPDATTDSLTVTNVQENSVGTYLLRVTQGIRTLDSRPADLQINLTGPGTQPVLGTDKFLDADVLANPILLGPEPFGEDAGFVPASVVRGYTGSQVFNTFGAVSTPGEPPLCGVPGGASTWLKLVAEESGDLHLNTDGSSFNTVMAVYERIVGVTNLHYLGCDDTNGLDRLDSALVVPVVGGRTNFIIIDGVNGATGVLKFNYNLVVPSTLTALGRNASGQFQFLITGKPGMAFTIQSTADLRTWSNLFTGSNAAGSFVYTDTNNPAPGSRWYRLRMLP